jgi:hypothetical protein
MGGYVGPLVMLTLEEAAAVLPPAPSSETEKKAALKIRAALAADPLWRSPLR